MKKLYISMIALTGTSAAVADVNLRDYTQATSAYEDAYVNAQFRAQSGNQDQDSYDLDLNVNYDRVFSSADSNTTLKANGSTSNSRGGNEADKSISNYQGQASVIHDRYLDSLGTDNFVYGGGEIRVQKGQDEVFTKLSAGIGHGRVVNATPMAKTNRLINALMERGLIAAEPSQQAYMDIATIVDQESQYRSKYGAENYQEAWIGDIEKALGVELSAAAVIKAYNVLNYERISTRKYGWLVRAGVGAVITDFDGENGKPLFEAVAEYHNPLSNDLQFSNVARFEKVVDSDNGSYIVGNDMSLTYELSDRVDWENTWNLSYVKSDDDTVGDTTSNTFTSTYRYYISNAISLDLTGKLISVDDDFDDNGNDDVTKLVTFGLNYRLK